MPVLVRTRDSQQLLDLRLTASAGCWAISVAAVDNARFAISIETVVHIRSSWSAGDLSKLHDLAATTPQGQCAPAKVRFQDAWHPRSLCSRRSRSVAEVRQASRHVRVWHQALPRTADQLRTAPDRQHPREGSRGGGTVAVSVGSRYAGRRYGMANRTDSTLGKNRCVE